MSPSSPVDTPTSRTDPHLAAAEHVSDTGHDRALSARLLRLAVLPGAVTPLFTGAAVVAVMTTSIPVWARIAVASLALLGVVILLGLVAREAVGLAHEPKQQSHAIAADTVPTARTDPMTQYGQSHDPQLKAGFANIGHRLQTMIHQAIQKLDLLERQVEDPDLLNEFFQVDHLVTRMLRQAESLAVLGGEPLQRQVDAPVHVHGLQRAALSETARYSQVTIVQVPEQVTVRGHVLGEIVHLLAELLENATTFSSPDAAKVRLGAESVPSGLSLYVEDRGLGIADEQRHRLNQLFGTPGAVDLGELLGDGRIGLATVAEIAQRHGIQVRLDSNMFGGTTAWVVLPHTLLDTASHQRSQPQSTPAADPQTVADTPDQLVAAARPQRSPTTRTITSYGTLPVQDHLIGPTSRTTSTQAQPSPSGTDSTEQPGQVTSTSPQEHQPSTLRDDQATSEHATRPPLPKRTRGHLPPEFYRTTAETGERADADPELMGAFWAEHDHSPTATPTTDPHEER